MKITDFEWLADENIHPDWIKYFQKSIPIYSLASFGLLGKSDSEILEFSFLRKFIVVTQDSDFGHLAITKKQPLIGIIYLRPGHLDPDIHIHTIHYILKQNPEVEPPFILVGSNQGTSIKIRVRNIVFKI